MQRGMNFDCVKLSFGDEYNAVNFQRLKLLRMEHRVSPFVVSCKLESIKIR